MVPLGYLRCMQVLRTGLLSGWLVIHGGFYATSSQLPTTVSPTVVSSRAPDWMRPPSNVWLVRALLASRLRGMTLENQDGQFLGRVQDFVVDLRQGQVRYVVVSSGGWLGIGTKLRIVPADLVSTATAKRDVLALDASDRRWQKAPLFSRKDLDQLNDNSPMAHYLHDFYFAPLDQPLRTPAPRAVRPTMETLRNDPAPVLIFTSELLGTRVYDKPGRKVGKITDLLIDLADHGPSLALVQASMDGPRTTYALSFGAMSKNRSGTLVLNVTQQMLLAAPLLSDPLWHKPGIRSAVNVFRYPQAGSKPEQQSRLMQSSPSGPSNAPVATLVCKTHHFRMYQALEIAEFHPNQLRVCASVKNDFIVLH